MQFSHSKTIFASGAVALALSLAGCGSGSAVSAPHTANVAANSLQFAVGTANLFNAATALNVVVTYRQPAGGFAPGDSGTLLNSPTLTLPAAIPAGLTVGTGTGYDACSTVPSGPATAELGTKTVLPSSQTAGTTTVTSFGQSGGAFGLGIEPFNATAQADCTAPGASSTGTPFQVAPYAIPLYDAASPTYAAGADPNSDVAWGGPPAFVLPDSNGDSVVGSGDYPSGTAGISEGIDVFAGIAPVAGGAYTLSVSIPANTGTTTQSKTFTLPGALKTIGTTTAPAYVPDAAGDGGGTFAFVMPTNATEAYLQITDYGPATTGAVSCNGSSTGGPVYYTIETTASGTLTLPPAIGPGGSPSACTAAQNTTANGAATTDDQIAIQVIAFDYDLYGASYPNSSGVPSPAQILAQTSDDLGISPAICQAGVTSCTASLPLLKARSRAAAGIIRHSTSRTRRPG